MLFDDCVKVILSSIALVHMASQVLPKRILQHLLFIACNSRDYAVVQAIVTSWPHSEISFDFMSNTLCQKYTELQQDCIAAQDYFNVKCSKLYCHCIPSIALGIFNNLLSHQKNESQPVFNIVDLSKIYVQEQIHFSMICELSEGHYPVNHPSNYISSSDMKALGWGKPQLHPVTRKLSLKLNIGVTNTLNFKCIQKLLSHHHIFNTSISGLSISPSLPRSHTVEVLNFFNGCYSNISFDASMLSNNQVMAPRLQSGGCLCLYSNQYQPQYKNFSSMFNEIFSLCTNSFALIVGNYDTRLFSVIPNNSIHAFGVVPDREYSFNIFTRCVDSLKSVIVNNKNTLEYLQLYKYPTSLLGAIELHSLHKLCVLSITSRTFKGHSLSPPVTQVCKILQMLNALEYFEWIDIMNLFPNDLITVYTTLKDYLPRLNHWHMSSFKVVLFTSPSDTDKETLGDLYKNLMEGKTENETCSTYQFSLDNVYLKNWLMLAKPDVCINLQDKHKSIDI